MRKVRQRRIGGPAAHRVMAFGLLVVGPTLAWATALAAQAPVDTLSAPHRFDAALDTVAELTRSIELIDTWDVGLDGIDGPLLDERRHVRRDSRRVLLWRLAELSGELPGVDDGPDPRVAVVDSMLRADIAELGADIDQGLDSASLLAAEALSLQGAPRARAEARVHELDAAIDDGLESYYSSLAALESLGVNVTAAYESMDRILSVRAELLAGRMGRAEADIRSLSERIEQGVTGLDEEIAALDLEVTETGDNLERVLDLMEDRELPTTDFRRYLLVSTGTLNAENLNWNVLRALVADWASGARAWFAESGWNVILHGVAFVTILALARLIAMIVNRLVVKGLQTSKVHISTLLRETIVRWSTRLVMLVGLLIALSQVGVELGPLLAGLGVAGFVIGFALQDTLSNFASGVMILLYRPFDVDDLVEVSGVMGKVADMSLVSTTILSVDNQRYIIPNSQIWGNVIQNVTAEKTRRVDLVFGIGYEDDIPRAERILQEIVEAHDLVLDEPSPMIKLSELADSSVNFVVRPWCRTSDYWDVRFDITRQVKLRFDEEGISIPFPQRDIHLYREDRGPEEGASHAVPVGAGVGESGTGRVGGILPGEAGQDEAENAPG